jgi:hypothetical protein
MTTMTGTVSVFWLLGTIGHACPQEIDHGSDSKELQGQRCGGRRIGALRRHTRPDRRRDLS